MKKFGLICLGLIVLAGNLWANIIDFEDLLPSSLSAMSTFISGNTVPGSAIIADKYSDMGIVFENAALVELGFGHAPSGINGIGGIDSDGNLDYGALITVNFVSLVNGSDGVTDYFSVTTDLLGYSGNTITLYGYDIDGNYIGSSGFTEGSGGTVVELTGIGYFHSVIIDETYGITGGIALDLVEYGDVVAYPSIVPAPGALILCVFGTAIVGKLKRFKFNN